MAEVYICGSCKRIQDISKGEKCVGCKKTTISWNDDGKYETWAQVVERWKKLFGK